MKEASTTSDIINVGLVAAPSNTEALTAPYFIYDVSCIDENGDEKWREHFRNVVTTVGKTLLLNVMFGATAKSAAWYMGLIGNTSYTAVAAADTLASHTGWTENTGWTGGPTRKTIVFGTAATGSITHTTLSFAITATDTINGCFVCDAATGTAGSLYSAGAFGTARAVNNNDTLNVTATLAIS
jgi:hypothetical protein